MTGGRVFRWLGVAALAAPLACQAAGEPAGPAGPAGAAAESPEAVFRRVFKKEPPPLPAARYPLVVDGMNREAVEVRFAPGDTVLLRADAVRSALAPLLSAEGVQALDAAVAGQREVGLAHLATAGLAAAFDRRSLAVSVDIPLELRSPVPLDMRLRRGGDTDAVTVRQADLSAYLTGALSADYVHDGPPGATGWDAVRGRLLGALNWRRVVVEGALDVDLTDLRDGIERDDVRVSYDDLERAVRYEALDLSTPNTGFQGANDLFGLSAYRLFDITPYRVVQPVATQRFTLSRPARVQVYVNGVLSREYRLRAGQYDLRDIPFASGSANQLELRLTYDDGETETIVFPGFFDLDLLARGVSEFALNAGVPEVRRGEGRGYDWDGPALSGYYRVGATDWLTLGGNAQAADGRWLVGVEALAASPVGTFGLLAALGDGGGWDALTAEGFYSLNLPSPSGATTLDLALRYTGARFGDVFVAARNEESWQARARLSFDLTGETRVQLAGAHDRGRGVPDSHSIGVSLRHDLGPATLGLGAERRGERGSREDSFRLALSIPLGGGSLLGSYDSRGSTARAQYTETASRGAGSWSYSVGYGRGDEEQVVFGDVLYDANRVSLSASHNRYRALGGTGLDQASTQVAAGAAVAYADGRVGLSRPIFDSFAIFSANEAVAAYGIAVDPAGRGLGSENARYQARTDRLGPAVLPDLMSYLVRPVEVHAPGAPPGVSVGNDVVVVQPGFRSGYAIEVGSDANVTVIGSLVDAGGTPAALRSGTAIPEQGGDGIPFFTNAAGRFFLPGLQAGTAYGLQVAGGGATTATLAVARDAVGLVRLEQPVRLGRP